MTELASPSASSWTAPPVISVSAAVRSAMFSQYKRLTSSFQGSMLTGRT